MFFFRNLLHPSRYPDSCCKECFSANYRPVLHITISSLFLYQPKIYAKNVVTSNKCGRLSSNPLIQSSYNFLLIEANVLKAKPNIKHNNPTNMHSEKNFYLFPFMRNGLSDCYSITESAHS